MSEKKKEKNVIYVKDLIIKADNVFIDSDDKDRKHHHRDDKDDHRKGQDRFDPFFGRKSYDDESSNSRHKKGKHDDESSSSRGGFSWI
ncbi:hypothetical protein [Halobacillus campisalis]|uniref:Uncharacterized protein n=1 Tax=Halobacillus campisalis TaxID=435909 RepID=A0ABW2K397_9BACI|nr:hypothetical protein [Halobacillus campisalis]